MKYSKTALKELTARYRDVLKKCAFLNAVILMSVAMAAPAMAADPVTDKPVFVFGDVAWDNQQVSTGAAAFGGRRMDNWADGKYQNDFPKYQMVGSSFGLSNSDAYIGPVTLTLRELTEGDKFAFNYQVHEVDVDLAAVDGWELEGDKATPIVWNDSSDVVSEKVAARIGEGDASYTAGPVYVMAQKGDGSKAGQMSFDNTTAVVDGSTVTAKTIDVKNGSVLTFAKQDSSKLTAFNGGEISSDGKTTLNADVITVAGSKFIVNNDAELVINGDNTTTTFSGYNGVAGALTSNGGNITANGGTVTFSGNKSTDHGAGLYYKNGTNDTAVTFNSDVSFLNNEVLSTATSGSGAGMFISGGNVSLLGENNTFTGNKMNATIAESRKAKVGGGAIANQSYDNDKHGPALDANMVIGTENSTNTFTGNTSSTNGGAIMNRAFDTEDGNATLTINGTSTFTGNSANIYGGAIYNVAKNGKTAEVTINGAATFSGNTANGQANDIYNAGILNLNAASGKTISLAGGIDGDAGTLNIGGAGTVDLAGYLKNQTAIVSAGELALSKEGASNVLTGSTITVEDGATINTINNYIDDYTTSITLQNGAQVKGDVNFDGDGSADKYAAAEGATVKYLLGNLMGGLDEGGEKTIQVASNGATVDISQAKWTSDNGLTFKSTGNADGKMIVKGFSGGMDDAADASGSVEKTEYNQTQNDTVHEKTIQNEFVYNGAGTEGTDPTLELAGNLTADTGSEVTLNNAKLTSSTGKKYVNAAGATTRINDSKVGVEFHNYGILLSDPTYYDDKVVNEGTATFDGDIFESGSSLTNSATVYLKGDTEFKSGSTLTGNTGNVLKLLDGTTNFGGTSTGNNVVVASGAKFTGALNGGTLDLHNGALDTITGSYTGGDVVLDANLGTTAPGIDTLGGVSGATIKEINVLGTEYGTAGSKTLALGTGATLDPSTVQVNGMNYYTNMAYNSTTGDLKFSDKLMNTSSAHALLGDWATGNYITASTAYDSTDAAYNYATPGQTVGAALTALDGAIGAKIAADGHYIKASTTNSVNANITALDNAVYANRNVDEATVSGTDYQSKMDVDAANKSATLKVKNKTTDTTLAAVTVDGTNQKVITDGALQANDGLTIGATGKGFDASGNATTGTLTIGAANAITGTSGRLAMGGNSLTGVADIASTSLTTNATGKTVAIGGTGYTTTVTGNEVVTGTLSAGATTVDSLKLSGSTPVISSVQTTVRATGTADDVSLVTEKAVRTALKDTTDALLAADNTWTGINTFKNDGGIVIKTTDGTTAATTLTAIDVSGTDLLNVSTGLKVNGDETVTGNLAVTGDTTLTGALVANGGITTTDIASTSLTTNAAGKTVAIGGTGYTTTVTGDLGVTGLTTFGTAGFKLGGKTVTTVDTDGSNAASSVAKATRQATLATAETVYAGAKTADYNGSTTGLNIAANETLGGAIGSLDTAIGDMSGFAGQHYANVTTDVASNITALDSALYNTDTILGPAETTAQTTGQFAGKKVGVDINVVDAVSELGVNMVSLGADNVFTGFNTFANPNGIVLQSNTAGANATILNVDPNGLTVNKGVTAKGIIIGGTGSTGLTMSGTTIGSTATVTAIDVDGSTVGSSAGAQILATAETVNAGAENAVFTGPSTPSAALGSAATINAAITNVASATDTNTADIATLQSGKMDKADVVTAWSSTPSDTKVASEKLVKDTLDGKANLTGGNSFTGTQTMTNTVADASSVTALSAAATNTAGSHSLVVSTDGVKVDGSDVLTQASIVTSAAGWSATTSDTKVASEKLVKDSLDAKVDNAGNFTAASNSDLIEGKTVIAAIQDTAAQVDVNTAAIGTTTDGTYVLAANSVGQNLNALDTQVAANTTAIGTTTDGTYVAAANSVGQNLNALDTQVAANAAAIAAVSGLVGADPTALTAGGALNQMGYANIASDGAGTSLTLADAANQLSQAFTNGKVDADFKSLTIGNANAITATTAGNLDMGKNSLSNVQGLTLTDSAGTATAAMTVSKVTGVGDVMDIAADVVTSTEFRAGTALTVEDASHNELFVADASGIEVKNGSSVKTFHVDATNGQTTLTDATGTNKATLTAKTTGLDVAEGLTVGGTAYGIDKTGAGSLASLNVAGNTTVGGNLGVTGTATLGTLTFNGTETATAISATGLTRGTAGVATTLATTKTVVDTITAQAQDATYTNDVAAADSNISHTTLQTAIKDLDVAIGNRDYTGGSVSYALASGTVTDAIKTVVADIGTAITGQTRTAAGATTAATNSINANIAALDAAIGGDVTGAKGNVAKAKNVQANLDALDVAIGDRAAGFSTTKTANYAVTALNGQDVVGAVSQVASNIGAAVTGANGNIAAGATVNANLDTLDAAIGDLSTLSTTNKNLDNTKDVVSNLNTVDARLGNIKDLDGTDATGPQGNLAAANSAVAAHLTAIDNRLGDIAGLNAKRGAAAKGNLSAAAGSMVEDHLVALDDAIGDRSQFAYGNFVNGANSTVDAVMALDSKMYNVNRDVKRLEKETRGGFASMAAMSALVPNARAAGDTQLSVGAGAYRDHQGIAVGAFHYFNDNVLANMGLSYGGDKSTVFRAGVTFGW